MTLILSHITWDMSTLRLGPPCALRLIRAARCWIRRALRLGQPCALRLIRAARSSRAGPAAGTKKRGEPKPAPSRFTLEGLQKFIKLLVTERTHLESRFHSRLIAGEGHRIFHLLDGDRGRNRFTCFIINAQYQTASL